ncbi:MAG: porin [Beijerinckiaceae bacterium]|nr:porin [Beijerinckiaceae bacterium]
MTFTKSILLGAAAAITGVVSAQAADLPARKSAPVEYVRICDAYGAGFFFIPGTQTCLRIGGRVRADYSFVPGKDQFGSISPAGVAAVNSPKGAQHTFGWEARGRISFDARTQTAWGTVQTTAALRMARSTGVVAQPDVTAADTTGAGSTLEWAFIRFAGFTFGASRDNFVMMPSLTYGAGHWGSFANGAKQIAYTHVFGGGFSATLALQDHLDTTNGGVDGSAPGTPRFVHNTFPQLVGRLELQQGWGSVAAAGSVAKVSVNNIADTFDQSKTVWAVNAGATINLPMLAQGSKLYLTAAYADGMTEYTTNWTSFKSTAYRRDVGGFTMNHPSYVFESGPNRIETVKSWNLAALLEHYWTPQYRSVVWGSYGALNAPLTAAAGAWNGTDNFGDAKVWNVGTNFAWLPTRDFEIGVEVIYARVSQDVLSTTPLVGAPVLFKSNEGNVTGRLRDERNF